MLKHDVEDGAEELAASVVALLSVSLTLVWAAKLQDL
jgi:hypothetical protein